MALRFRKPMKKCNVGAISRLSILFPGMVANMGNNVIKVFQEYYKYAAS